jgi:hypothetical protein
MEFEQTEEQKRYGRYPEFEPRATADLSVELEEKYRELVGLFGNGIEPVPEVAPVDTHLAFLEKIMKLSDAMHEMELTIANKGVWLVPTFRIWLERRYAGKWITCPVRSWKTDKYIYGLFKVGQIRVFNSSSTCELVAEKDSPCYRFNYNKNGTPVMIAQVFQEEVNAGISSTGVELNYHLDKDDDSGIWKQINIADDPDAFIAKLSGGKEIPVKQMYDI